eukprot:scaffold306457_cov28-Tisochrysis_lutea.AAC.2
MARRDTRGSVGAAARHARAPAGRRHAARRRPSTRPRAPAALWPSTAGRRECGPSCLRGRTDVFSGQRRGLSRRARPHVLRTCALNRDSLAARDELINLGCGTLKAVEQLRARHPIDDRA